MISKKGEMTTQQIVVLIVLIASFAVLLFFLFRLNLGQENDREICHNSVIMSEKSLLPDQIPLNCKKEYVCISEDGTCEKMTSPRIEKVEDAEEVYQVLADELANCWWMFGEGRVDYVGEAWFDADKACSLCSQIAFDESVKEMKDSKGKLFFENGKIDKKEFYLFLSNTEISKGKSYSKYLLLDESLERYTGDYGNYNLDKQYYSLVGIFQKRGEGGYILEALGVGVLSYFTFGGGLLVGAVIASVEGYQYFFAPVIEGDSGNDFIPPTLVEANSPEFNALNCKKILTLS